MITLHILADNAAPAQLERALLYLKRTKQRSVNIGAGAELLKGMQYVDRVRAECPGIKIFWRNMEPEDTGIHTKMSAQSLFNKKIAPYLDWFKKNEIILVCDNESSGDDNAIREYVRWTVELLVIMHAVNLATAVCRFATGNIGDGSHGSNQYPLLKPIFTAMLPSDWASPNEYSNAPGKSSGGHLARYKLMWEAAGRKLPTFIGEAGVCPDYNPGKGFRSVPMTGKAHAAQLIAEEVWYPDIDRALFVVGGFGWEGFQLITEIGNGKVEADTLDALEDHYAKHPPIDTPTPPPPPAIRWINTIAAVTAIDAVLLRETPTAGIGNGLATIKNNETIDYAADQSVDGWWFVRYNGIQGWLPATFFHPAVVEMPAEKPPTEPPMTIPPIDPPLPEVPALTPEQAKAQLIAHLRAIITLVENWPEAA